MTNRISESQRETISNVIQYNIPFDDDCSFVVFTDASVKKPNANGADSGVGVGWVVCTPTGEIVCYGSKRIDKHWSVNKSEMIAINLAINQMRAMDWLDAGVAVCCDNRPVVDSFKRDTSLRSLESFKEIAEYLSEEDVHNISRGMNDIADMLSKDARKQGHIGAVEERMQSAL